MTVRFSIPIATVTAAIGTTLILTSFDSSSNVPSIGLLVLSMLLIVFVSMLIQPLFGAVGILGFAFVNPTLVPSVIEVGDFSLRYADLLFLLLALIVCIRLYRSQHMPKELVEVIVPLLPFLVYTGLS